MIEHIGCKNCKYETKKVNEEPCCRCKILTPYSHSEYEARPDCWTPKHEIDADELIEECDCREVMIQELVIYCLKRGCVGCPLHGFCEHGAISTLSTEELTEMYHKAFCGGEQKHDANREIINELTQHSFVNPDYANGELLVTLDDAIKIVKGFEVKRTDD